MAKKKSKEKLIDEIFKECEKNGEPVTWEEATEMAEMEIKAEEIKIVNSSINRNRKKTKKSEKKDDDKIFIIQSLLESALVLDDAASITNPTKTIDFHFHGDSFTITLTRHNK